MLLLVAALPTTADLELEVPGWRGSLPLLVGEGFPLGPKEICSPGLIERRLALQEESHHIHITFPSQLVGQECQRTRIPGWDGATEGSGHSCLYQQGKRSLWLQIRGIKHSGREAGPGAPGFACSEQRQEGKWKRNLPFPPSQGHS